VSTIAPRLGQVVREHRLAAGLSQEELADRAGLHRTYISLLERGLRNPSVDALSKIGRAIGAPASRLLAEAEEEPA
jgi:transcriptional regulator with XRE-family HTH domain